MTQSRYGPTSTVRVADCGARIKFTFLSGSIAKLASMATKLETCELCEPELLLFGEEHAYIRYDNNSLKSGHVLVISRRHVSNFFDMTRTEKASVLALMDRAKAETDKQNSLEGYNIGINIERAGGQSRMQVHVHFIPRYGGDLVDPSGGIRCVLTRT